MIKNGFSLAVDEVFDLIQSVYQSTDAFASDFEKEYPSEGVLGDRLDDLRKRPGSLFLVASAGNELQGYLFIVPRAAAKLKHTADLNMGVRKRARSRGFGGEMLRAALDQLRRDRIIEIVYLMVRADNPPAKSLYKRYGFEEIATLSRDTKVGAHYFDGVLMRKWISNKE